MEKLSNKYSYVPSSVLSARVQIKIGVLEGFVKSIDYRALLNDMSLKFTGPYQEGLSELYVKLQVFNNGKPLRDPVITSHKVFTTRYNWNEWVTLPIQFNDVPRTAQLALTVYDCGGGHESVVIGGTTISLFSKYGQFRKGIMDLRVWPGQEADGSFPSTTPAKTPARSQPKERDPYSHRRADGARPNVSIEQIHRLAKLKKKYENGHISEITWLDRLTFRELEVINEMGKRSSNSMYLMVDFGNIKEGDAQHIVYFEQDGDEVYNFRAQTDKVRCPDMDTFCKENPVENKYHKLARSLRSGHSDKDAKPTAPIRDKLNQIVAYPTTTQLSNEEQDYVWKYRFYLSTQKKALTKFLKCVNWGQSAEVKQALSMLEMWAPMDVEDALELLGPGFTHPAVRRYAISRLQQAPDEDLMMYLLQLVQALKYENFEQIKEGFRRISAREPIPPIEEVTVVAPLAKNDSRESNSTITNEPTINRSASCSQAAVGLGAMSLPFASTVEFDSLHRAITVPENLMQNLTISESANTDTLQSEMQEPEVQDLASFLISRACRNAALANYFYWYLLIECEDHEHAVQQDSLARDMYLTVMKTFSQMLARGTPEMQRRRDFLTKQQKFIDKLVKLIKRISGENCNRKKKAEKLQQLLADTDAFKFNWTNFEPFPFPLDPEVMIKGIVPEKASLFKSAFMPSKLHFVTTENKEYVAIFKHGDDLRQDQLILQMITLMDKLLRRENLDLKLTPYKVLAISTKHGFVQFIDSYTVAEIVASEGSILNFLRKHHPQENGPYGVCKEVMETYVKSCAGYCVIAYLLGVGDRHLDNLLVTTDGKLFHIDFGYILGRDPKPLPPPMKLSKEMMDTMGGVGSDHFAKFKKYCFNAFLHLRRHGNLMLNLFSLMVDASVPDIALEPDKVLLKIEDKLRRDLTDEEAAQHIQYLIDMSVTAVMAHLVDQLHKFAQYWRK